jgi:hypothetical protein
MARTVEEIYNSLIAEKEALDNLSGLQPDPDEFQTFLQDLTSTSKVALWRLLFYVVAFGHWVIETLQDRHVAEVTALKYTLITGTPIWYRQKALEFQYGDALTWNGAQYVYDPITESNQIVKRAAVVTAGGITRVKVAKLDVDGVTPIPLTSPENVSFTAYMESIAFAGVNILVISTDADEIIINATIYYDPLVLTPTGESIEDVGVFPAEDAINAYISNLPFNGVFNKTQLVDAIQAAEGVVDPVLGALTARYGSNPFASVSDNYTSFAGHMTIAAGNPLSSTLTYVEAP